MSRGRSAQVDPSPPPFPQGPRRKPANGTVTAVQFDPEKRAVGAELRAAIKRLVAHLEAAESLIAKRQRQRKPEDRAKFGLAVEAITCNLVALVLTGSPLPLAVPRGNKAMWSVTRYRSEVYGQGFLDVLDLMAAPEVGFAETVTRGFKLADGRRQQTTIRPTPAFLEAIQIGACSWADLERRDDREVLILRGLKNAASISETLDYSDTERTRRLRKEVRQLNGHLSAAPLFLTPAASPLAPEAIPVDPTRKTVRRVFNNGSWGQGGRLFDGFWETMPREARFRRLLIGTTACPEGEPISNVDYGQLFTALAYRQCNKATPEGDLYDINGDGSQRDGFKKLLNALLFATGPMTRWPEETAAHFPGQKLQAVLAAIREHHAPIANLFGIGIGFRLMALESTILIDVCLKLFSQGITALPLHDSVLVARSQEAEAERVMHEAYAFHMDARAKLHVDKAQ